MITKNQNIRLQNWIENLLAKGRNTFSLEEVHSEFLGHSKAALTSSLSRLTEKGKVISILKGFYTVIPPQYSAKGALPPVEYIDDLMRYLGREYYVGLLNAAALYGAAHQSPQEYFVFTRFPVMRPTLGRGLKVNYISRKTIPKTLLQEWKTAAGYIKVSVPALTALDLIQFSKRIGGIQRASSILEELAESIDPSTFSSTLLETASTAAVQRLGYVFEFVLGNEHLADGLFTAARDFGLKFLRIPLVATKRKNGFSSSNRWNIIVNEMAVIEA